MKMDKQGRITIPAEFLDEVKGLRETKTLYVYLIDYEKEASEFMISPVERPRRNLFTKTKQDAKHRICLNKIRIVWGTIVGSYNYVFLVRDHKLYLRGYKVSE